MRTAIVASAALVSGLALGSVTAHADVLQGGGQVLNQSNSQDQSNSQTQNPQANTTGVNALGSVNAGVLGNASTGNTTQSNSSVARSGNNVSDQRQSAVSSANQTQVNSARDRLCCSGTAVSSCCSSSSSDPVIVQRNNVAQGGDQRLGQDTNQSSSNRQTQNPQANTTGVNLLCGVNVGLLGNASAGDCTQENKSTAIAGDNISRQEQASAESAQQDQLNAERQLEVACLNGCQLGNVQTVPFVLSEPIILNREEEVVPTSVGGGSNNVAVPATGVGMGTGIPGGAGALMTIGVVLAALSLFVSDKRTKKNAEATS